MIHIKKQQRFVALRWVYILMSIIFLWCFGMTLLIVIMNIGVGFADNEADFKKAFLIKTSAENHAKVNDYLITLHSAEQEKDKANLSTNLQYYKDYFSPDNTNYRFAISDKEGNLLLTNDPDYGKSQDLLATIIESRSVSMGTRQYQIQKHFSDPVNSYNTVTYGNASVYLDRPEEFDLWYFSNYQIDDAYHHGLDTVIYHSPYTDFKIFSSKEEAMQFDFELEYGESCSWKEIPLNIAQEALATSTQPDDYMTETGFTTTYTGDGTPHSFHTEVFQNPSSATNPNEGYAVEITAYDDEEIEYNNITLSEYYRLKQQGWNISAIQPELEKSLMEGLDITVRGHHDDMQLCYFKSYIPSDLPVNDAIRSNYAVYSFLFQHAESAMTIMFISLILVIFSCIVMCHTAGKTVDSDEIQLSAIHQFTYECFWFLPPCTILLSALAVDFFMRINTPYRTIAIFCIGMVCCIAITCILWLYTTAIRIKTGTFWSSFGFIRMPRRIISLFRNRTAATLGILAYCIGLFVLNLSCIQQGYRPSDEFIILFLITLCLDAYTLIGIIYFTYSYFELHRHALQIKNGNFTPAHHPIPLIADFKDFDQSLNEITVNVEEIVAKQTKAEHLRTELITNVSHDLKTPLTSIVNYVDLLSREPMQTETATEYLEVLKRQAARLKKLTVDLVDASKASTGNLSVELVPTGVQVLLEQLAGEYEETFENNNLHLVLNTPDTPLTILADSRQIWRVFDNLLNNACKYAMSGSRVYMDVVADDFLVEVTLKNVSATPLNISPDELMERFVRGDSSRSTEGSGLGLSIARDLTALQGGILTLQTDGDLFKVSLTFPLHIPPANPLSET